jgi:hypothetical protein
LEQMARTPQPKYTTHPLIVDITIGHRIRFHQLPKSRLLADHERGIHDRRVSADRETKSVSSEATFEHAVDRVRARFGDDAVIRGLAFERPEES